MCILILTHLRGTLPTSACFSLWLFRNCRSLLSFLCRHSQHWLGGSWRINAQPSGRTWMEAQFTWFLEGSQQDHNNSQLINPTDSLLLLPCPFIPTLYPAAWITSQINCLTPRPHLRLCFWRKASWDFMFGVGWTTTPQGWKNPDHYTVQLA